jgi:hypothetical protein
VRRLLVRLVLTWSQPIDQALAFSAWRRHHQATAKLSHYRARGSPSQEVQL